MVDGTWALHILHDLYFAQKLYEGVLVVSVDFHVLDGDPPPVFLGFHDLSVATLAQNPYDIIVSLEGSKPHRLEFKLLQKS